MISMAAWNGMWCPHFTCDHCGEGIHEGKGIAAWEIPDYENGMHASRVWHLHKGECERTFNAKKDVLIDPILDHASNLQHNSKNSKRKEAK